VSWRFLLIPGCSPRFPTSVSNCANRRIRWHRACVRGSTGDTFAPAHPRLSLEIGAQVHWRGSEEAFVHELQARRDTRPERHVTNDVAFEVDPRSDLDKLQSAIDDPKDGALGDEDCGASFFGSKRRAVAHLFNSVDELPVAPFLCDRQSAINAGDLEATRGERATENHMLGVLADIDEAADADDLAVKPANVDVAFVIHLHERQEGKIETAAIVEIELVGLIDNRIVVLRRS
jgi:hypothetical protein